LYEGEIKKLGDKVYIRTIGDVTVSDYHKNDTITYENIESPDIELTIDYAKKWAFKIDNIDRYQSDIKLMDKWAEDATYRMKKAIEETVLPTLDGSAHASNKGTTAGHVCAAYNLGESTSPVDISRSNIINYICYAGGVLDEENVPETDRFLLIPSIAAVLLKTSDIKDASLTGDNVSTLRNGRLGRVDRFTIYTSNLLEKTLEGSAYAYNMIFGHPMALTFASQYTETKFIPQPETTFGQLMAGLNVFGFKVIKEEALGCLYGRPVLT